MIEKDTISNNNKKNHCHVYINIRKGRLQDMDIIGVMGDIT